MSSAAVVLIDMQVDVIHHREAGIRAALDRSGVVRACVGAVGRAHDLGVPVIFVTVVRRRQEGAGGSSTGSTARPSGAQRSCVEGTRGAEIIDELSPGPGDFVVVKRSRGAFHNTELDGLLRQLRVSRILLGGVATNLGVESTARSAFDLGYQVTFLRECCAGFDEADHAWALERIFPKIGEVMDWGPALDTLRLGGSEE